MIKLSRPGYIHCTVYSQYEKFDRHNMADTPTSRGIRLSDHGVLPSSIRGDLFRYLTRTICVGRLYASSARDFNLTI